jgi:hypothetical protein
VIHTRRSCGWSGHFLRCIGKESEEVKNRHNDIALAMAEISVLNELEELLLENWQSWKNSICAGTRNDILVVNQESIFRCSVSKSNITQQFQKNLYHFDKDLISEQ